MVKNDVAVLTSGCDPRSVSLLDIMNTSVWLNFPMSFWAVFYWLWNDDTHLALKYNVKMTFNTDCKLFKTIARTKCTVYLNYVQLKKNSTPNISILIGNC